MIPRRLLFGNPEKIEPSLSPDGTKIAYLAPRDGVLNVFVGPLADPDAALPVTEDAERGIATYLWAHTSRHVLYLKDAGGDEDWHVYSVDLETGRALDLTPGKGISARVERLSREFPREIVIALNEREAALHDLFRVDIETGRRQLLQENPGFAAFAVDDDYRVRLANRMEPDGGATSLQPDGRGGFEDFLQVPMEDVLTTRPIDFDKTGRSAYLVDSRGRDTGALATIDLETGEERILFGAEGADVTDVLVHPTEKTVQAVAVARERVRWEVLDERAAADFDTLRGVADGELEFLSRSDDDAHWMVAFVMDDGPVRYYHYEREKRHARFLFTHRPALETAPLAKMNPVAIRSRDGLELVSYLTLPRDGAEPGAARPRECLPMVLLVHGGPWSRDEWGFDPFHQLLADRGYAVLSVNYRGSTGLGKRFVNAGNREWGARMHEDLLDAVAWAVAEGIADPKRVAIMGGSYGGYAALVGLTLTPDVFACGIDIVGPSNLVTLLESVPPYWEPQIQQFRLRVGDHTTEDGREFLTARSPLAHVERIARPLLIAQGANDPRVKRAESDRIVDAMREKNIPVTYVLYPDEGHGFARPENNLSFMAIAEAFLARHLGGRYEPLGDAFLGSSLEVMSGAAEIPGLEEELSRRRGVG